ncbi:MAG: 50S ribosomal protein L21e [Promethearchaeati archaeon SRVP18_Atabeyarchaeia-1]
MKGTRGYKNGTRKLLRKHIRSKGMIPLGRMLREYSPGEKVNIIIDSSIAKGQPHKRFHGKVGEITEKRGRAYVVLVKDGNLEKQVIARPEHLVPHK